MKKTLKILGSVLLIVPALIWIYRTFFSSSPELPEQAPNEAARKVAEQELVEIKKEVAEIEKKEYTDQEIMDKFNKE